MGSFADIQRDHLSLAAREVLPVLRNTVPRSGRAKAALDLLNAWDGSMEAGRAEPLIFNAWMRAASRAIFEDELGDALMNDYWEQRNIHRSTVNVLQNKDGQGRWCVDVASAAGGLQNCADVLSVSLETALDNLERRYGKEMAVWRWGEAHVAHSEHRPFGKVAALAGFFDIQVETAGDTFTVNAGRHNLRDQNRPFANRHAAGLRALYDLSDLENSVFMHSTGQSGNILSPLYRNYSERWARVEYLPMKTRREDVEKNSIGVLTLIP